MLASEPEAETGRSQSGQCSQLQDPVSCHLQENE